MNVPDEKHGPNHRVLLCVSTAFDEEVMKNILGPLNAEGVFCCDPGEIARQAHGDVDAILINEEVLDEGPLETIIESLSRQPDWSDLPVLLVRSSGAESPIVLRAMQALTNVLLLDRPVRLAVMTSAFTQALRARSRQYRLRDLLGELQHSRQLMSEAESLSHTGAWEWDLVADKWTFSDEWLQIHGCTGRILMTDELMTIAHPEDRPAVKKSMENARRGIAPYDIEHRIVRKDDRNVRFVHARGQYIKDTSGKVIKVYGFARDITERRKRENELREIGKRYHLVNQATNDIIWDWNLLTDDLEWNEAVEAAVGRSREELPDTIESWHEHIHPDDRGQVVAGIHQAINRGQDTWQDEYRFGPPGGPYRVFLDRGVIARDAAGNPYRMIGSMLDLTDRKKMEKQLRESEQRFRTVFEQAAVGIGRVNFDDARWIEVNETFCRMLGYTREEMLSTPWPQITHPEDLDLDLIPFRRMAAGELDSYTVEKRFIHKQGNHVWARLTLSLVRDASGVPDYEIAIIQNITGKKMAEEALQESEERLRFVLQSSRIGTWELDLFNQAALRSLEHDRIFGYEELLTEWDYDKFLNHVLPEDRALVDEEFRRSLSKREAWDFECRIKRTDGEIRWIWAAGRQRFDQTGNIRQMAGIVMDITERKKAEEELRESAARIKASLEEKEVLLKEIHHRVKNNMQVISSLVSLQADELKDLSLKDTFEELAHRVRSMAMVHEKLYQSEDLAQVNFADYARNLLDYVLRAYGTATSGIRLNLDLEPVFLSVVAAVPCGLILNELVSNAIKHAFVGRAEGEVTVSLHSDADHRVYLRVSDNGNGLPAGFDWKQYPSLGLRLVRMLARQLRAEVEVSSNGGTEFTILFKERSK